MIIQRSFLILMLAISTLSCNIEAKSNRHLSAEPISIRRFDKDLLHTLQAGDTTLRATLYHEYPVMLDILGKSLLNMKNPDNPDFFEKLEKYYSEPTLLSLYKDAVDKFENVDTLEIQLGKAFTYLKENLPALQIPDIYMHVSGFNQNILVGEGVLSISIDKYLGSDYPLYQEFFYDYQKRKMQPDDVLPDYLTGWLMAEYPYMGKENVLLERMIYEGKIKYLVSQALPEVNPALLLGYTEEEYSWAKEHEGSIWKTIIERKQLYTPDYITTGKYFEAMPSQFLADNAPGNLGSYIGWQIVSRYMKETKATLNALINNNAQDILSASKYKP